MTNLERLINQDWVDDDLFKQIKVLQTHGFEYQGEINNFGLRITEYEQPLFSIFDWKFYRHLYFNVVAILNDRERFYRSDNLPECWDEREWITDYCVEEDSFRCFVAQLKDDLIEYCDQKNEKITMVNVK